MGKRKAQFKTGFKTKAEDQAVSLRHKLGLRYFDPMCAFKLVQHFGIALFCPQDFEGLSTADLLVLNKTSKGSWSAVTIKKPDESFLIIYNKAHAPARTQSDLMHEMAHIICGHENSSVVIHPALGFPLRSHDQQQEDEAEWLGGCLQLPRVALVWALQQGMGVQEISNHYKASTNMVNYRLNVTGLRKQMQSTSTNIN